MNKEEIAKIRAELDITQLEMSKRLGVDVKTIQNWESGKRIPASKHGIIRALVAQKQPFYGGEQSNIHGDNIIGNNVTMNQPGTDKVLQLLQDKEKSLHKAQEQIDRLLAIIEKMAK